MNDRQLDAAVTFRAVSCATAVVPPSASMTSDVDLSVTIKGQDNPKFLDTQPPRTVLWKPKALDGTMPPMAKQKTHGSDAPHARRLRLLREVLGYQSSAAFAAFLGVSAQRWNNFENGMPLSLAVVNLLKQKVPGITADWLLFGSLEGLSFQLARELTSPRGKTVTVAR